MKDYWNFKIFLMSLVAAVWIYIRELDYYSALPTNDIITALFIFVWAYITLTEPYFLLVGLGFLYVFGNRTKTEVRLI
jgi:hypothetical protein